MESLKYHASLKTPLIPLPRRENERRYEEYHDWREGTLVGGYSLTQLASAVRHLWQSPDAELDLRTLADLLLANAMLLRAGNAVGLVMGGRLSAPGSTDVPTGRLGPLSLLAIVSVLYSAWPLATFSLSSSSFLLWFFLVVYM